MKRNSSSFIPVSGPARSRRFGLSLNVNFGTAGQSCLWNCIYCPWHDSSSNTKKARRDSKLPEPAAYLSAISAALKKDRKIETLILGGNSEPTLFADLPALIEGLKKLRKSTRGNWKLVALSNGSRLLNPDVHSACESVDQLWLKLDCAEDPLFQKTIRPLNKNQGFRSHLQAIRSIKQIRIQTTLWKFPGRNKNQNWTADHLVSLLELYRKIQPIEIHLTTLKRKKHYAGVQPVSIEELEAFALRVAELGIPTEVFP